MGSNGSQKFLQFIKTANATIRRSIRFPDASNCGKVAQDGRFKFKSAGWINSCWIQFGRLGKVPKSKFTAFSQRDSTEGFSSTWNTLFLRNFKRNAADRIRNRRPNTNKTQKTFESDRVSPDFPPVPSRLSQMDRVNLIYKPLAFTALVGTGSIVGCTIWQYEEYRKQVSNGRFSLSSLSVPGFGSGDQSAPGRRSSEFSLRFSEWWESLTPGEKVFWPICAINGLVSLAWRVPGLTHIMVTYFSCNPMGRAVCFPMLLSTFSHYSFFHLAANMFVLHSFIPAAAQIMGKEQFLALYLTSGTVASLGSHFHKVIMGSNVPSLGASGAIMGILGLVCTRMPDIQLGIIFLPGIQFTADTALKCMLAVDSAGLICGWRMMDHAAHLAGCLFGIAFSKYGKETFWVLRDYIMKVWHKLRTQGIS